MCEMGDSWFLFLMLAFNLVALPCLFFLMESKNAESREKANKYRVKYIALKSARKLKKSDTK